MTAPTEKTAAEKLAEGAQGTGDPAGSTTPPAEKPGDGTEGTGEGQGTGDQQKPAEKPEEKTGDGDKPEVVLNAEGKPFTKVDHDALTTALKAARKDAKDRASELAALKAAGGDRDPAQIVTEAQAAAEQVWKPRLVKLAAESALRSAGLALPEGSEDKALARAVRMLDTDALTITDDGIEGLTEQIEALKTDLPDLFAPVRRSVPRVQAGERPGAPTASKSTAELLMAQLSGR